MISFFKYILLNIRVLSYLFEINLLGNSVILVEKIDVEEVICMMIWIDFVWLGVL